jgi:caffeoyl-CoA O-methyltransferase
MVDQDRRALLDEMYAFGREHGGMWNVGPESGAFLHLTIQAINAQHALEIGMSNGYSTIWIADALEKTGGHLTTLEADPRKVVMATENLTRTGLLDRVEIIEGDARESVETLDGLFDFVFIDADKESYPHYLRTSLERAQPGAIIAADNVRSHEDALRAFVASAEADPRLESIVLPIGSGVLVCYVRPKRQS